MGALLNLVISVGPIVLGLGLLLAGVCIAVRRLAPARGVRTSTLRFILRAFVVGVVAFVAGTAVGIAAFCSSASSGNLCGLGGIFGIGPILSGVCVGWYALVWRKR
jgi:hypothetical protein